MRAPLIVVSGTGTEIGKTHLSAALLRRWGTTARVMGLKPVESGVAEGEGSDARMLREASTFHVKPWPAAPYTLPRPVSPHLAAAAAGVEIALHRVVAFVDREREHAEGVLVELAGGLFSPLTECANNADLARALEPTAAILVAPDRLGVLHDVGASVRAAAAMGLSIAAIVLVAPPSPDSSTGTNASEMRVVSSIPVFGPFPRDSSAALAGLPVTEDLLRHALRP